MSELYTSLSRAKQILMATRDWRGEGAPPPPVAMTPVPEAVHHIVNPAYTIGLGALRECGVVEEGGEVFGCPECRQGECQQRGLQCPVCGEYRDFLKVHIDRNHPEVGGYEAVREALSIPRKHKFTSKRVRGLLATMPGVAALHGEKAQAWREKIKNGEQIRRVRPTTTRKRWMVGERNHFNTCEAQIKQRFWALRDKVGRSPGMSDARAHDPALKSVAIMMYGTWNNAKVQCGLDVRPQWSGVSIERSKVLAALLAWYEVHGDLPNYVQAQQRDRLPLIPSLPTIRKAFEVPADLEAPRVGKSQRRTRGVWDETMRRAAAELGIHGGKYGLPDIKEDAA